MADFSCLDCFDDLISNADDGIMRKADGDGLRRSVIGKSRCSKGSLDDRGKILLSIFINGNVPDPRPGDQTRGENPILLRILGLLDAIGRHQDCTGELVEFLSLILPGSTVVTNEVLELLQARIRQTGKHLAVSIDIDTLSLGLFEQFAEVF